MNKYKTSINISVFLLIVCGILFLGDVDMTYGQYYSLSHNKMSRKLPPDTTMISKDHEIMVKGQKVPYKVIYGTLPVPGEKTGDPIGYVFYTYFKRTDVKNLANRPILFSFNGGPGSGDVWQMLGFSSPKRLKVDKNGFPVRPLGITDNHHSLIDVTDLVYIDAINTGYSRMLKGGEPKDFAGTYADTKYLARAIYDFISRFGRWGSPKFLLGESYGTTRVAGLAGRLQGFHSRFNSIYLNGVILVSGGGGIGRARPLPRAVFSLPHFTVEAWYFKQLSPKLEKMKLTDLLDKVEKFDMHEYLAALIKGGSLSKDKRQAIAEKVAKYTGLSKETILHYNLAVPSSVFQKTLLSVGKIGRLDGRYVQNTNAGPSSGVRVRVSLAPWAHAFGPAINIFYKKFLGFNTDLKYYMLNHWWPHNIDYKSYNTGAALRAAMEKNPAMQVLFQYGYFDGGFFHDIYASWQLDLSGRMQDRIHRKGYFSGHMMYMRKAVMIKASNDVRKFIRNSIPEDGQSIMHSKDIERKSLDNLIGGSME